MSMERLSQGPWEVIEVMEPDFVSYAGWKMPEIAGPAGKSEDFNLGHCGCCGQAISWRVLVQDVNTKKHYIIGRACAQSLEHRMTSKEIAAKRRQQLHDERRKMREPLVALVARHSEKMKTLPHPFLKPPPLKGAKFKKSTLLDYANWSLGNHVTAYDFQHSARTVREKLGLVESQETRTARLETERKTNEASALAYKLAAEAEFTAEAEAVFSKFDYDALTTATLVENFHHLSQFGKSLDKLSEEQIDALSQQAFLKFAPGRRPPT